MGRVGNQNKKELCRENLPKTSWYRDQSVQQLDGALRCREVVIAVNGEERCYLASMSSVEQNQTYYEWDVLVQEKRE